MLCARCLAMSFHLSKARPDGQFMNAQPSAPRGPLHPVTVIAPPLLITGPAIGPEMVCREGTQAAWATPDAPSAASATSEAEASSAARERPTFAGVKELTV